MRLWVLAASAACIAALGYPHTLRGEEASRSVATNQAPIALNLPGLPNAYKVSDDLYRGAQPTKEGFEELVKFRIKTIINLRAFHSDKSKLPDKIEVEKEEIPMKTWSPKEEEVVRFLKIVTDPARTPVFVHCQHGADRTGTMCAIYRIVVCGWSKEDAVKEMTTGGFGFHKTWQNLIDFINNLDIEAIKKKAGLAERK